MKINSHKSSPTKYTINLKSAPSTCTFDKTEKLGGMGMCSLIRRLENKGKMHRQSFTDPEREVAWWLETKSGSGMETTVHTAVCGAFRGKKQFGRNC